MSLFSLVVFRMLKFVVVFWALVGASVLGAGQANDSYQIYVQKECSFTRYPSICVQTMMGSGLGHGQQHVDIMLALANKTISETMLATSKFVNFSSQFKLGGELGAREAQRVHSVKGSSHTVNVNTNMCAKNMLGFVV